MNGEAARKDERHALAMEQQRIELCGTEEERLAAKLAQEKERRVEELYKKSAKRMGNQGILRGWSAWHELYEEMKAQRQMLASAGARLLRPKLAASMEHWRRDWEVEVVSTRGKGDKELLADARELAARLEAELGVRDRQLLAAAETTAALRSQLARLVLVAHLALQQAEWDVDAQNFFRQSAAQALHEQHH